MQGLIRASARLLAMGLVLAAVLALASFAGLGTTMALALGILSAGIVGIVSLTRRRPHRSTAADEIAAMMAPERARTAAAKALANPEVATAVDAMAPPDVREVDPEANMPRWRRPSLLEARRSDYSRLVHGRANADALHRRSGLPVRRADRPLRGGAAPGSTGRAAGPADQRPRGPATRSRCCPRRARSSTSTARTASGASSTGRPFGRARRPLPAFAATTDVPYEDALSAMLGPRPAARPELSRLPTGREPAAGCARADAAALAGPRRSTSRCWWAMFGTKPVG